jgi:hypothetical protein
LNRYTKKIRNENRAIESILKNQYYELILIWHCKREIKWNWEEGVEEFISNLNHQIVDIFFKNYAYCLLIWVWQWLGEEENNIDFE